MKRLGLILVLFSALPCAVPAAPPVSPPKGAGQTIERNLTYLRVHALPDDLPAAPAVAPAAGTLVLDLRFVPAGPDAATAFAAWLKDRARPRSPVLVLVNQETAPALLALLAAPRVPAGVVSIGPAAMGVSPDVALDLDAGADRAAYEALDRGMPIGDLIDPKVEKIRHDEAAMAKERATAATGIEEEDDPAPPAAEKAKPPAAPVPPVDRVLQRAVQLYHALVALKKIP